MLTDEQVEQLKPGDKLICEYYPYEVTFVDYKLLESTTDYETIYLIDTEELPLYSIVGYTQYQFSLPEKCHCRICEE